MQLATATRGRVYGVAATVGVAALVYLPLAIWLTAQFGSPLPTTLQTKSAQAVSGLTGFYPFTSFPQGGGLLVQALVMQSPLLAVFLLLCIAGAFYAGRRAHAGFAMPVIWGVGHMAGYTLLGVAPYVWYYAPALPGLVCLAAWGTEAVARLGHGRQKQQTAISYGLAGVLVAGLVFADLPIMAVVDGATPPPPSDLRAKLLPETKVDVYARVGQWVHDNTASNATLGVTELGVMSYYAGRHAVDFLGLTQPQNLAAIRHGDYLQALIREQPDVVALSSVNSVYDLDPQRAAWFTSLYTAAVSFEDDRFWGSPMVVWRRKSARVPISSTIDTAPHDLGDDWQITGIRVSAITVTAGSPLMLRLQLKAGRAVGTRTLRVQPVLIQGGDGLPVSSRLIYTNQWKAGEQDWVDFPILPQAAAPKGGYVIQAGWLEGGPQVQAGYVKVSLNMPEPAGTPFAPLSVGAGVQVFVQPMTACLGARMPVTITWRGGNMGLDPYTAFVQLRQAETVVASADAPPRQGTYPTPVWTPGEVIPDTHVFDLKSDTPAGDYALVVGLYIPTDNTRLPVDASPYRTPDGGVKVADVHIGECR